MKISNKFFIILFLLYTSSISNENNIIQNETASQEQIFERISKVRVGLKKEELEIVENPFISSKVQNKITTQDLNDGINNIFVLKAIMSNRAKINDRWYKIGDSIENAIITNISSESVVISNQNEKQTLKIARENPNVQISK
ncbi:hypothetical protein CPIN18021_0908 [Campylobacter pinnipediorum subsp. caledonicus]|uniref:Transformation system protein n=1 Tax=Campylobacter pinnipediorum subsp. caledonicus TaxID=1874362 RepID=A0A1S6U8F2_9BACT|nr:hypothetical protein [Campylobacter pinnipediorum]AQW86108.1 hypothetical protein CPIN18020_0905 [Campylobacter pinnipediorum subsp. caledonicus]AQW87717.1 hypothetical protein CPIN18021_0908 [Campylobacter pinnipediorum subsp. caledonicus]